MTTRYDLTLSGPLRTEAEVGGHAVALGLQLRHGNRNFSLDDLAGNHSSQDELHRFLQLSGRQPATIVVSDALLSTLRAKGYNRFFIDSNGEGGSHWLSVDKPGTSQRLQLSWLDPYDISKEFSIQFGERGPVVPAHKFPYGGVIDLNHLDVARRVLASEAAPELPVAADRIATFRISTADYAVPKTQRIGLDKMKDALLIDKPQGNVDVMLGSPPKGTKEFTPKATPAFIHINDSISQLTTTGAGEVSISVSFSAPPLVLNHAGPTHLRFGSFRNHPIGGTAPYDVTFSDRAIWELSNKDIRIERQGGNIYVKRRDADGTFIEDSVFDAARLEKITLGTGNPVVTITRDMLHEGKPITLPAQDLLINPDAVQKRIGRRADIGPDLRLPETVRLASATVDHEPVAPSHVADHRTDTPTRTV